MNAAAVYSYVLLLFVTCAHCRVTFSSKDSDSKNSLTNPDQKPAKDTKPGEVEPSTCDNLNNPANETCPEKVDTGEPLILTKYIEEGRVEDARNASSVDRRLFFGYESYSGFLTVNKTYNSNTFFWYFPVVHKPANESPWIIWLQGGPGASSLTGVFKEIGPCRINSKGSLLPNPFSWVNNHSLVFIDNPIGTGFSFTDSEDGYATNMDTYSHHLYLAVKQLLQVYPELQTAPLFIAGESYAGKYVPALGMQLHRHIKDEGLVVNFKGLMMGNPYIDPENLSNMPAMYSNLGLLVPEELKLIQPLQDSFVQAINEKRSVDAKEKFMNLVNVLSLLSHQSQLYNFLRDRYTFGNIEEFVDQPHIRKALHVGGVEFSFVNITVNTKIAPDFLSSSKPLLEELLEHYRVLVYCGHLDLMLPCSESIKHHRTWKWSGSDEFLAAPRYPFRQSNSLAGYYKTGGGLTEVVVRGAGHVVATDVPVTTLNLVTKWVADLPLSLHDNMYAVVEQIVGTKTEVESALSC